MAVSPDTILKPGDLVLFKGSAWLSKAIRWATRGRGEAPTWANHAGIVGIGDKLMYSTTIEALATVRERVWDDAVKGKDVQVWRHKGLSQRQRLGIVEAARDDIGQLYGPIKIIGHLLDGLLAKLFGGNPFVFRRLFRMNGVPICSRKVEQAYWRGAGYLFTAEPDHYGLTSPDDLHDWVKRRGEWERVGDPWVSAEEVAHKYPINGEAAGRIETVTLHEHTRPDGQSKKR